MSEMTALEEAFLQIVCDGGSPVAKCACGKLHFTTSGEFMDEGELERIQSAAIREPARYQGHDSSSVSHGLFAGETLVWNCDCGRAKALAESFWKNRFTIAAFFADVATRMITSANELLTTLQTTTTDEPR